MFINGQIKYNKFVQGTITQDKREETADKHEIRDESQKHDVEPKKLDTKGVQHIFHSCEIQEQAKRI